MGFFSAASVVAGISSAAVVRASISFMVVCLDVGIRTIPLEYFYRKASCHGVFMSNGSELDPVEQPAFGPFLIEVALRIFVQQKLLTKVERMMQREQDLPLSFFVRDCHDDSEGAF